MEELHDHHNARERLKLFKSPIASDGPDTQNTKDIDHTSSHRDRVEYIPRFRRYEEPTILEIFYDLFFAANYGVFSDNRQITNHSTFKSYIGYFCLLWLTWFLVTSYDVRFVTDSIFERVARALQLGVLIGFAVVAPNFDPMDQNMQTMRTMSLILMFSRAILVVEYGSTLIHTRKYKKARTPLYASMAINAISMFIYLGITFRFRGEKRSRVYMIWYFISGLEAGVTIAISRVWPVLSFTETHLMKRLTLLTVMILGDGLANIAKEVVTIVKTPAAWDSLTIGLITAGVATIYFVFLIYFDWLRDTFYLPPTRQLIWTTLHLPFHLSLVMFVQAFTQYILWAKVMSVLRKLTTNWLQWDNNATADITTVGVVETLRNATNDFFNMYPAKMPQTLTTVKFALQNLTNVPDSIWPELSHFEQTGDNSSFSLEDLQALDTVVLSFASIATSLTNSVFRSFGIDIAKDVIKSSKAPSTGDINTGMLETQVSNKTWRRYRLVFAYGYISAGCCLLLMSILSVISRTTRWKPWPIARLVILTILAIGTGLVALLWLDDPGEITDDVSNRDRCLEYLSTPWVLLTIFVVYTVALVLTHIGGKGSANKPKRKMRNWLSRSEAMMPDTLSVALTPSKTWGNGNQTLSPHDAEQPRNASLRNYTPSTYQDCHPEDIGVAYSGHERPPTSYGPLSQPTTYRGTSHPA